MEPGRKSFDRVAHLYDATRGLPPEAEAAVAAGLARALAAVAHPHVLEVGVGTGRIAVPLARTGARVVGIDVAPAMLARLREKGTVVPAAIADAVHLPFRAATFDAALFVHLLHLLPDAAAALEAAARAVRPGGLLLYGRTDEGEGSRRRAVDAIRELMREVGGVVTGTKGWNAETNRVFAEHARAKAAVVSEMVLARWRERTSGREMLEGLAGRVYSSTWAIPDACMPELLARSRPCLVALLGDLDRVVEHEATFTLVTARLPP